jgi:outer membrane lipoprotein-sorting protein
MNKARIVSGLVSLLVIATIVAYAEENHSGLEDEGRTFVYTITEKPTAYQEADRLGIWFPASDFEPLGLYLSPDQAIEIKVRNIRGNTQPRLLVGTYSRYKYEDVPTVYDLVAGPNAITDSQGGLLYLQFVTAETPSAVAEVSIDGGSPIPSYVLGESTHAGWLNDLNTMSYENVQFISNRTMVVVSKATALQYKDEDQDFMLTTLDRVSDIADYISGIDGSSDLHKPNVHKILITELAEKEVDFTLAAEEYRILVPSKSLKFIMDPAFASTAGWGLWHEMGHHRQALNWDWNEVDEVSVNIYSLACLYELDGTITWLKGKEVWDVLAEYFETPIEERNFNTDKTIGGNGRLAMFRQLWMAFGDEFYIKVHQLAREDNAKPDPRVKPRYDSTGDQQMAHFMLLSSAASGYNLKNFFRQWGFKLPQ